MKTYITYAGIALFAFLAGKYLFPQTKTEIKEVIRTVEVEKKVEKKTALVHKIETKKKDGTVVIDTTTTEVTDSVTDKTSQSVSVKATKAGSGITLGLIALTTIQDFGKELEYGVTVLVPVMGKIKLQALGTTDKRIGLGLAVEF